MIHMRRYKQDFAEMNKAYVDVFTQADALPFPARSCVGAELGGAFDVEITVVSNSCHMNDAHTGRLLDSARRRASYECRL